MRIHSIANSPYFGYNKELNEKVNNKLRHAKGNKELANTLLALNTYCMETEDKLRKAEAENNQNLVDKYDALLIGVKNITANQINNRFPELHYREKELKGYKAEAAKRRALDPNYWLNQLILIMDDSAEIDQLLEDAIKTEKLAKKGKKHGSKDVDTAVLDAIKNFEPEKKDKSQQSEKVNKPQAKTDKKIKKPELPEGLEEFKPNKYSPRGFVSVGGMDDLKASFRDKVIEPVLNPELAKLDELEYGKRIPRGYIFYGPPGCGKTYFLEAVAQETGLPLFKMKVSKVGSKFVNQSANNIQSGFDYALKIAEDTGKPVFLMLDEMETLTSERRTPSGSSEDNKVVSTLLQALDDVLGKNVIVIGSTNKIDMLDSAVKSRLDETAYIGLPDDDTRYKVLTLKLNSLHRGVGLAADKEKMQKLVALTKGFSNRTIESIVLSAGDRARLDGRRDITFEDFVPLCNSEKYLSQKVNENLYKTNNTRPAVGFNPQSGHGGKMIL